MRGNVQTFTDFRGGLNAADSAFDLQPNQARDLRNVVGDPRGAIRTRKGCRAFADAPADLTSLWYAPDVLFGATEDTLQTVYPAALGISKTGFANGVWDFAGAPPNPSDPTGSWTFMVNGHDTPQFYDGTQFDDWVALSGTVPNGTQITYLNNQVFVAGVLAVDKRSTLYASQLDSPFDWNPATAGTSAYELPLNPHDHDKITALCPLGEYLLVFKQASIYVVTDTITGANRRLDAPVGTVAPRSVVETPNGVMFLGSDSRVWMTDGTTAHVMSHPVNTILEALYAPDVPDTASGAYHGDHYYLSVLRTDPLERVTLDYDFTLGSWWVHDFAPVQWASYPNVDLSADARNLLYGQPYQGDGVLEAFVEDVLTDDAVAFTAYWKGPHNVFGSVDTRKRVRQIRLSGTGEATFKVAKDFAPAATTIATASFGIAGTVGRVVLPTPGVARAWSLEVEAAVQFELDAQTWAFTGRAD
jgi:hypothetical protein